MAQALHERSDYMRTFAMHVSHEFKTPLSSIRGAAELMQDCDDMEPEKKNHFLSLILNDTDCLTRLVSRLLELARADALIPDGGVTDIGTILPRLQQRFAAESLSILYQNISCAVALSAENLEGVLSNLFDNAHRHGATSVIVGMQKSEYELQITITDNGEGISAANMDKIFTPFFTTRREKGGTGLGLDIVRSILERHNAEISVVPVSAGARFILKMPLA